MSYQYILLDWDGNLAKTLDVWMTAIQTPLKNRGIDVSDDFVASQLFGLPRQGFADLGITDVETAFAEMEQCAKDLMPNVELYPDTLLVLEDLKRLGKHTALITSNFKYNIVAALDKYNIHQFFDVIIAGDDLHHSMHKPHPEPIEMALRQMGGNKDDAVMIGDSDKDIMAANNAMVDSILFYPDVHTKFYDLDSLRQLGPTHIVSEMRDVIDIVK